MTVTVGKLLKAEIVTEEQLSLPNIPLSDQGNGTY